MIALRYAENQRYDINLDAEVTRMMAMTTRGTWWADTLVGVGAPMREKRAMFKRFVAQAAAKGMDPCEVKI